MATQAKKASPATATRRARDTKPAVDYGKLAAQDTELPAGERSSLLDGTPFLEWLTDSRDRSVAKAVVVPQAAVKQTTYLVRQAGKRLNVGVRIIESKPDAKGQVRVSFQAKKKRATKEEAEAARQAKATATTAASK
jgi:hypothetical protein